MRRGNLIPVTGNSTASRTTPPRRDRFDVVVDAMFGFSFQGPPRPPFDQLIQAMLPPANPPPILSIDIPSGWDVDHPAPVGEAVQSMASTQRPTLELGKVGQCRCLPSTPRRSPRRRRV